MTMAVECALPREAAALFELPGPAPEERFGIRWAERELGAARLVVAEGGMGTTNAAATAQFLCQRFEPAALVFEGIAGGLNPQLGVGDIVVGARLCRLEADMAIVAESAPHLTEFASDARLVGLARQELAGRGFALAKAVAEQGEDGPGLPFGAATPHAPRYVVGCMATSDLFSTETDVLARVRERWQADCEEMECAAAAQVAARAGVPFLALRCLSNVCGEAYADLDGAEGRLDAAARTAAEAALGVARRLAAAAPA